MVKNKILLSEHNGLNFKRGFTIKNSYNGLNIKGQKEKIFEGRQIPSKLGRSLKYVCYTPLCQCHFFPGE